ncbi:MAG: preprotein translocase subunit YajC [Gammaproteobacteria bacterium]
MSFLISDALAEGAAAAPGAQAPGLEGLIFPLAILLFFYLLFIRPQSKRSKEQKKMLQALTKGAEVVTSGGLLGKVVDVDENFVQVEIAENTVVQVQRHAVANMVPKGTFKAQSKKAKS